MPTATLELDEIELAELVLHLEPTVRDLRPVPLRMAKDDDDDDDDDKGKGGGGGCCASSSASCCGKPEPRPD